MSPSSTSLASLPPSTSSASLPPSTSSFQIPLFPTLPPTKEDFHLSRLPKPKQHLFVSVSSQRCPVEEILNLFAGPHHEAKRVFLPQRLHLQIQHLRPSQLFIPC